MRALKALMVAAALAAAVAPAQAAGIRYYNDDGSTVGTIPILGSVDFMRNMPIACRNLDDAIEAAGKFTDDDGRPGDFRAKLDFVRLHQAGSKRGIGPYNEPFRIKPKGDCVVVVPASDSDRRDETAPLDTAVAIKMKAPRLPAGMIAICVFKGSMVKDACDEPTSDKKYEGYVSYWVVMKPKSVMRNFDLPKE